jgi:DNA-binding response OmpR family regulator
MDILLIETDPDIEKFLSVMIRSGIPDAQIISVISHEEAVDILQKDAHRFAVILTDNESHGKNFIKQLSSLSMYGVPVVILGSDTSERAIVEALRRGAADYISRRNLKFEKLPVILRRAALEKENWANLNSIRNQMTADPRVLELDQQILQHLEEDRLERNRHRVGRGQMLSLPTLHEGHEYNLIIMYCVFGSPLRDQEMADDRVIQSRENLIRTKLEEAVPQYGGQIWSRGNRFLLIAMPLENPVQTVLLALQFRSVFRSITVQREDLPAKIKSGIGVASDRIVYRERKGEIISNGINLAAHIAFRELDEDGLVITSNLLSELGKRTLYYFSEAPEFEGRKIHRYEFRS